MFDLTPYEIYIFCLCMVVFTLLTVLFIVLFAWIMRLFVRQIRFGVEDKQILKEYKKYKNKTKRIGFVDMLITLVFCVLAFSMFGFSVYTSIYQEQVTTGMPLWRVVLSSSMSEKNEKNKHLFEQNLNDQFDRFDLVLTEALPAEQDLKLYDIVVYEVEEMLIIHRIVGIEEPNEKHPEERWFLLQGDAVPGQDRFPVLYSQMKAIYKGTRIPFVGSFVAFLQSPAGYICILLVIFGVISIPLMEKKLYKERRKRMRWLMENGKVDENGDYIEDKPTTTVVAVATTRCCPARCPYARMAYRTYACMRCPYNQYRKPDGK